MRKVAHLLGWIIFGYLVVLEVLLLVGFVLVVFGVEPSGALAGFVYRSVERATEPFRAVFQPLDLDLDEGATSIDSAVEGSIVFAMVVYGILALFAHDLVQWLAKRPPPPDDGATDAAPPDHHASTPG